MAFYSIFSFYNFTEELKTKNPSKQRVLRGF